VETGEAILDAVGAVKRANATALYCCDPVIGDVGPGVYVQAEIPRLMRERAVPLADVVTPNRFELEQLTGRATPTIVAAIAAIEALHALGPAAVLVTSLHTAETPDDAIDLVASDAAGVFRLRTPRLPIAINGAGDAIAALFFFHYITTRSVSPALSRAASSLFGILRRTAAAGSRELLLIDAQDELVRPTESFVAEPL
jgi:pyridoxine kinase